MKKRVLPLLLTIAMLLCLCSCAMEASVTFNEDGTGVGTIRLGIPVEMFSELVDGDEADEWELGTINGQQYMVKEETETFQADDYSEASEGLAIFKDGDSYTVIVTSTSAITDEVASSGMDIDLSNIYIGYHLTFPWPVTQTAGTTDGVTINGTTLSLSCTAMTADGVRVFVSGTPVTDVPVGAWYYAAMSYVRGVGIFRGYDNGKFGPTDTLTIAQLCQVIYNLGEFGPNTADGTYWAYDAIATCLDLGLICDRGDIISTNYDVPCSREVAVSALSRYYLYWSELTPTKEFPDMADVDPLYLDDIRAAYEFGIVSGSDSAGTFKPKSILTRAEMAQIIYNVRNLEVTDE